MFDGSLAAMHIVKFNMESGSEETNTYFINEDPKTLKLTYMITPHNVISL